MTTTRMTSAMRRSLERRLADLDRRIETMQAQREGDDPLEATALLEQLTHERNDVVDALHDAMMIDEEPFDSHAVEVGDTVTIREADGRTDRYVLVDRSMRTRAQSDWVSVSSPLGAALLGRSKGDEVQVQSPSGTMFYVVVDFERASDDSVVLAGSGERIPAEARGC